MSIEHNVVDWLAQRRDAALDLLASLVDTDSGSYDKPGVDAVGERISTFLRSHGIDSVLISNERFGDAIRVTTGAGNRPPVLLLGHRDTVFPQGEATRRPFTIKNGKGSGPGCADMKAGLVMNAMVLAAFKAAGVTIPVVGLFTSDEEIASPSSKDLITREAGHARAVFNAEPGRPGGKVVTGRKGGVFMRLNVIGKAAHAGNSLFDGISAIEDIARKIIKLHALRDADKGITVNVGTVAGGQTVNTVAPRATAEIDLRFIHPQDRHAAMAAIERIVATSDIAGSSATLAITGEFAPMVTTDATMTLFTHYAAVATEFGFTPTSEFAGGCSDAGYASSAGVPTICGIGPVGGKAHTPDEFVEIDTIIPRAQSLAVAILRLDDSRI